MRPFSNENGNFAAKDALKHAGCASMRPFSNENGNREGEDQAFSRRQASMRPFSNENGNMPVLQRIEKLCTLQ